MKRKVKKICGLEEFTFYQVLSLIFVMIGFIGISIKNPIMSFSLILGLFIPILNFGADSSIV